MKLILITAITILLLSLQCGNVYAQINNEGVIQHKSIQSLEYNQFLKKSHNQKVTTTIMGITGGIICLTGVGLAVSSLNGLFNPNVHHNDYGSAPEILSYGGIILMAASIPFAIAAKKNKKKATLSCKKKM